MKKLLNRIPNAYKTLAWSTFYQVIAFTASYLLANLDGLQLDPRIVVLVGLILTGISKAVAKKIASSKK